MSTGATTTTPRRAPTPTSAPATRATVAPNPGGLWIVPRHGKRAHTLSETGASAKARFPHRLDAADGAQTVHRHFLLYSPSRHRREGTDRASSLRSDERVTSPRPVIHIPEIGDAHLRNRRCTSPKSVIHISEIRRTRSCRRWHYCPTFSAPQQHLRVWGTRWRGRREQLHQWTAVEQVELENS